MSSATFDYSKTFADLNLPDDIFQAINDLGYVNPTLIQSQSLPHLMEGLDVIGQSHTGSGKTIAFGIPALEAIDLNINAPQILIMCPTRELANQVAEEIGRIAARRKKLKITSVYGGTSIERQIKVIAKGVHIVVGTPGRILDHLDRGTLRLDQIRMVILDEADRMLDMGFVDDMKTILAEAPVERQTVLFSATMPKPIMEIAKRFQKNPFHVKMDSHTSSAPKVEQFALDVSEHQKMEAATRIIKIENPRLALVFCNTKRKTDEVVAELQSRGVFADGLHGDMKQAQRDSVMHKFRQGTIEVLVATDVAARGLDIDNVDMVINYDFPQDPEQYVHRIGRTGRAGREGKSYAFIGRRDRFQLNMLKKVTKSEPTMMRLPSQQDVDKVQAKRTIEKLRDIAESPGIETYRQRVEEWAEIADLDMLQIAAALLRMNSEERESSSQPKKKSDERFGDTGGEAGYVRFFANVGRVNRVMPKDIIMALVRDGGINGTDVGRINIYEKFTFFEILEDKAEVVYGSLQRARICGISVNVEPANQK